MGTHSSGEATIKSNDEFNGQKLSDLLKHVPEYVGNIKVLKKFGCDLPFLFKVLSVQQPLSIQSHPDKTLAVKLHARDSVNYPDDNHKPEMAIAITNFSVLCSFRPHSEIEAFLKEIDEFRSIIGEPDAEIYINAIGEQKQKALQICFSNLMKSTKNEAAPRLQALASRIQFLPMNSKLKEVFLQMYKAYPEDSGCFCLFFLNYIELEPGQGIFLGANEPHCYISGGKNF